MPNEMTASEAAFQFLPIHHLEESPTNPRRSSGFEASAIAELAESIKAVGVLQPILARPHPSPNRFYQIVAGARRFRAAKAAGLDQVPALVRDLTDVEVLELQVVENSQRQDPHPLDEAEGYAALCKAAGWSREQLAARLGKSRSHVYARLALTKLIEPIKEKFAAGEFGAEIAGLIARMPEALQEKALKAVTGYQGQILPFRDARHALEREFDLRLADAPFDVKNISLVPAAGACAACPKRTGNEPELFTDLAKDDICLDEACFDAKRQAHYSAEVARLQAEGYKLVEMEWPKFQDQPIEAERADLPHPMLDDERPLRELMPKKAKPVLAVRADGMPALVYREEDIEPVVSKLQDAEFKARRKESPAHDPRASRETPEQAAARKRRVAIDAWEKNLETALAALVGSRRKFEMTTGDAVLTAFALGAEYAGDTGEYLEQMRQLAPRDRAIEILSQAVKATISSLRWMDELPPEKVAELVDLSKRLDVVVPE
jgi:ParB/RepB/Spo0J family partition protein